MDIHESMINEASTVRLTSQDDPARQAVTTHDIRSFLRRKWGKRANTMPDGPEHAQFGDMCWSILQRNDPREMITYLTEQDMVKISLEKYREPEPKKTTPLTPEEMQRMIDDPDF